jgi:hypothetical protein
VKNIERYAHERNIKLPDDFIETCTRLRVRVSDFRDKKISHMRNPRSLYVTMFNLNNPNAGIGITKLYPKDREIHERQVESDELPLLLEELHTYTDLICELVTTNRARSRYKLKL